MGETTKIAWTPITLVVNHLPARELSPNTRAFWTKIANAKRDASAEALALVRERYAVPPCIPMARVSYTFYIKGKRRHDPDNLVASMKAYLDGIVWSGLLPDDNSQHLTIGQPIVIQGADVDGVAILIEDLS